MNKLLLTLMFVFLVTATCHAEDSSERLTDELFVLADVVMSHHLKPPTRQQLILGALAAAKNSGGQAVPDELARTVSDASPDELRSLAKRFLSGCSDGSDESATRLRHRVISGLLAEAAGKNELLKQDDLEVRLGSAKFSSNTYVGIGIVLVYDNDYPTIAKILQNGSAAESGALDGDVIQSINGASAKGIGLTEAIRLLRGTEGSQLRLTVCQPMSVFKRDLVIERRIVPRVLVSNYEKVERGIASIRIDQIGASTVHELRKFERLADMDNCRGLIVDMRNCRQSDVHYAIMLADALADEGVIGQIQRRDRTQTFTAESGKVFPDTLILLLLGPGSSAHARWIAGYLQDGRQAQVVGRRDNNAEFVQSPVAVPDTANSLLLATAQLVDSTPVAQGGVIRPKAVIHHLDSPPAEYDPMSMAIRILRTRIKRAPPEGNLDDS